MRSSDTSRRAQVLIRDWKRHEARFLELRRVDFFACGHPFPDLNGLEWSLDPRLYWCRLVAGFEKPMLGIWDMTHQFAVPEQLQAQLIELF